MLKRTALVDTSSAGRQSQCRAARVVEHLVTGNKAQCLDAAVDGLVCKRSSNLIQILTIEVRILEKNEFYIPIQHLTANVLQGAYKSGKPG